FKINEHLAAGLGYYSLYNYSTKWDDNWEGRFITRESSFSLNVIEPAVSYKFNDFFGIGIGYVYGFGNYESRKAIAETGTTGEATTQWTGSGKCGGFIASMFAKFNDEASAGLTFRAPMDYKIKDGTATFSGIPSSVSDQYPSVSSFTSEYKFPASVSGALAYQFTDALITTLQIDYTFWSRMDSLHIIFSDSSFSSHTGPQLNNTLEGRFGVQYDFTDQFSLRGGFAYEQSPYPTEHVTPEFPDANKTSFSLGAGYKFNDKLSADMVITVENYFERKAQDIATNFKGSYKTVKYLVGIGFNYNF
ncbi:MAG: OmpP1/FadL family transporter, partial [Bacteroidia bacterium]